MENSKMNHCNFVFGFLLQKALEVIGFSSDEILSIFKVVSIILKLGNLVFLPTTNIDGTGGCEITNDYGR